MVKSRQHKIIRMEQVNPFASGTRNAGVPTPGHAQIVRCSENGHAVPGNGIDQRGHVNTGRTIIDHFITTNPAASPEIITYARAAMEGKVQ